MRSQNLLAIDISGYNITTQNNFVSIYNDSINKARACNGKNRSGINNAEVWIYNKGILGLFSVCIIFKGLYFRHNEIAKFRILLRIRDKVLVLVVLYGFSNSHL